MAKPKKDSAIAMELEQFKAKIEQFQLYLEAFNVINITEDKKRHDEVACQIKIMDSLPGWLGGLEKLLEDESAAKAVEVRGDGEMSGLMKNKEKA